MFSPGEVVFVESDQVANHATRNKYHVCVCGYRGHYFFINSKPWTDSFRISQAELPALPKLESHISCNTLLTVDDAYMQANGAQSVGFLSADVVGRLIEHIEDCSVLNDEEKEIAIDGLSGAL